MIAILKTIRDMNANQLGRLGFNITAFSWVGMCLTLGPNNLPAFVPGSYLHPNLLNAVSSVTIFLGAVISVAAIRKGNIVGPVIALTFLWSVGATLLREAGLLNGSPIS